MKIVLFCHSFVSCWNHGNAHFFRGIARELLAQGHEVAVYEPCNGWSRENALRDGGAAHLRDATSLVDGVELHVYDPHDIDLDRATEHADVVIVHEWNDPWLVRALGALRARSARFVLLFHDTHHRAVSAPEEMGRFDLSGFDGVLAFGAVLRDIYVRRGWGRRCFVWHEAADTTLFRPIEAEKQHDLVWVGNWGDDERTAELREFLIVPCHTLRLRARVHGVRYPQSARDELRLAGINYGGWLPNHLVPAALAAARVTVHVPRSPYVAMLPGIPTIRMFEALACGIPLVSAPWDDAEDLFTKQSYLRASDGNAMQGHLRALLSDASLRQEVTAEGLRCIRARHTCAHRAQELMAIVAELRGAVRADATHSVERAVA